MSRPLDPLGSLVRSVCLTCCDVVALGGLVTSMCLACFNWVALGKLAKRICFTCDDLLSELADNCVSKNHPTMRPLPNNPSPSVRNNTE
jgi:predicted DNA-binding ribbon-helix-helix protein